MLQKKIAVQFEVKWGATTGSWNVSNFVKHLKRHLTNQQIELSVRNSSSEIETKSSIVKVKEEPSDKNGDIAEMKSTSKQMETTHSIVNAKNETNVLYESTQINNSEEFEIILPENEKKILFEGISAQNLKMMETVLRNDGHTQTMVVKSGDQFVSVDVVNIPKDGNCLSGACAHQLHFTKIGTETHKNMVAEQRSKVVKYILDNFDRFYRCIKLRLVEEGKDASEVGEIECKEFVEGHLSKSGEYGGAESLMAISEMESTNIIVFNERDTYYFSTGYNASFDRFICIAYRMNLNSEYYHYDSVCKISPALMYN